VGDRLDNAARRERGLVPDLGDASLDHVAARAREQLRVAPRAELAGGDLRSQVTEARIRVAQIVADDLPERLVALARLVDLERAHLQAFAIDVIGGGRAEALMHAADV